MMKLQRMYQMMLRVSLPHQQTDRVKLFKEKTETLWKHKVNLYLVKSYLFWVE